MQRSDWTLRASTLNMTHSGSIANTLLPRWWLGFRRHSPSQPRARRAAAARANLPAFGLSGAARPAHAPTAQGNTVPGAEYVFSQSHMACGSCAVLCRSHISLACSRLLSLLPLVQVSGEGKRVTIKADDPMYINRPNVNGAKFLCNGEVRPWSGKVADVESPIYLEGSESKIVIGNQARMSPVEALEALDAAVGAWNKGKGEWPQMPVSERISCMEKFVAKLRLKREAIVNVLMWEICKVKPDAEKEFDRTMDYIAATIAAVKKMRGDDAALLDEGGILAQHHRNPIGVMLNLGPFNYPFNETYTTLIPAIIMGNTAVMKIPNVGALAHMETMEAFAECFPKGVVNFISGAGRETMPPIMATGKVDIFAFIGTSKAADALIKAHPCPHRLKSCLSLEAKNVGIILADADIDTAVTECALGALSYNGQRCTAIKQACAQSIVTEVSHTL